MARNRMAAMTYPEVDGWADFTRLTTQHADLQARYRDALNEADRLDRTRDQAQEKDRDAYAQALLDGKGDPGQKHTQAHDKAAADKRREGEALRVAVQRTEDTIHDLLEAEGGAKVAALEADLGVAREKAQALLAELATHLGSIQDTQSVVAWVQRTLREGRPTSYRALGGLAGRVEGLKRPNGEDHILDDVLAALNSTVQPPTAPTPPAPGTHVPLDQQNWGHVGSALTAGGFA